MLSAPSGLQKHFSTLQCGSKSSDNPHAHATEFLDSTRTDRAAGSHRCTSRSIFPTPPKSRATAHPQARPTGSLHAALFPVTHAEESPVQHLTTRGIPGSHSSSHQSWSRFSHPLTHPPHSTEWIIAVDRVQRSRFCVS